MESRVCVRVPHPITFGVWIAITTVGVFLGWFGEDAQEYVFAFGNDVIGRSVGYCAVFASILMIIGTIWCKWQVLSWGLMLAAMVFISRTALYAIDVGVDSFPLWISLGLSFATAGAWCIERDRYGIAKCPWRNK